MTVSSFLFLFSLLIFIVSSLTHMACSSLAPQHLLEPRGNLAKAARLTRSDSLPLSSPPFVIGD
jgi:hypothetical protein